MKINCLLVDDEHLAQVLLEEHIKKVPHLKLVAKCDSAVQALQVLHEQPIDLMFLDIHMPELGGLDLLKMLRNQKPAFIFTTAYSKYAPQGYQLDAIDYLLKPITFERFIQAVNKATEVFKIKEKLQQQSSVTKDYMFVKSGYKTVKVRYDDILYIEGLREYVQIYMANNQKIVILESIKNLVNNLPERQFLRVHKSYIVAVDKVDTLIGNTLEINGLSIPVSKTYRTEVGEVFR